MKNLIFCLLLTSHAFSQCKATIPGQAVCAKGTPCTISGASGTCTNTQTIPGQPISCACAVPSDELTIPLDNTWILLLSSGIYDTSTGFPALWMTTVNGNGPLQGYIDILDYDNPNDDGLFTLSPTPALTFPIPSDPVKNGYITYFWYPVPQAGFPMQMGGTLTFTIKLTTAPGTVFEWMNDSNGNVCAGVPARVRPMLAIGGVLSWEAFTTGDTGRWFTDNAYATISDTLGNAIPGTYTITAPLDPTQWSGVFGQTAVNDPNFASAVATPENIALVNGGGCFFGHGIKTIAGSATLSLLSASYTPPTN